MLQYELLNEVRMETLLIAARARHPDFDNVVRLKDITPILEAEFLKSGDPMEAAYIHLKDSDDAEERQ